jgi:fructose-1,6-bisphosphatase II / sedoheptulose-1,7-bisphosphatase
MGITDPDRIYSVTDMAKGDVLVAATGITSGRMLRACVVPAAGR